MDIEKKVKQMNKAELIEFAQNVSLSVLTSGERAYFNALIDLRYAELCNIDVNGISVVWSDMEGYEDDFEARD